jgi:hypothetical protein
MPIESSASQESLASLARTKLSRVLGEAQGQRIFSETLAAMQLAELETADQLYAFGEQLTSRGGFEAAVGRLLSVAAVMRGAKGSP